MNIEIIGLLAGFLSTVEALPQIQKIRLTRSVKDFAMPSLIMIVISCLLWLVYGIVITSLSLIVTASITAILYVIIIVMKRKYDK